VGGGEEEEWGVEAAGGWELVMWTGLVGWPFYASSWICIVRRAIAYALTVSLRTQLMYLIHEYDDQVWA